MPNNSMYPLTSFFFEVSLDSIGTISCSEVTGINAEMETLPLKEGGVNTFIYQLPVRTKYNKLTLKRGVLESHYREPFFEWIKKHVLEFDGEIEPVNAVIRLKNAEGEDVITWNINRAYPVKWTHGDLGSTKNEVFVETIELVYQNYTIE